MKTRFTEHSDIQIYVENIVENNGKEIIDTLYVKTDVINSDVTISIEDSQGENADFIIKKENLQQVIDWLRSKQFIY